MERFQVHCHIECEAVERAAAAHAQAECGDLGVADVDARRAVAALGDDVPGVERVDQRLLDPVHQLAHADLEPAQVEQWIGHDLARAVVGDLAAAVDRHDRDLARQQHVFPFAGLAEREHRIVFEQPQLIGRVRPARVGERLHRVPDGFVGLAAEAAHEDRQGHGVQMGAGMRFTTARRTRLRGSIAKTPRRAAPSETRGASGAWRDGSARRARAEDAGRISWRGTAPSPPNPSRIPALASPVRTSLCGRSPAIAARWQRSKARLTPLRGRAQERAASRRGAAPQVSGASPSQARLTERTPSASVRSSFGCMRCACGSHSVSTFSSDPTAPTPRSR